MKNVLGVPLICAIMFESGCSGDEHVRCRGAYRFVISNNNQMISKETGSNAVLGFNVERAPFLASVISRKDWKGVVDVSYVSDPYSDTGKNGGGVIEIGTDIDGSVSAIKAEKNRSQSLFYDPTDGAVVYSDIALASTPGKNDSDWSFFGMCQ